MNLILFLFVLFLVKSLDGASDKRIYEAGVSKEDQYRIVNIHNNFRKMIAEGKVPGQPKGVNLKRMKWDDKLASAAQNIANSCEFAHKSVTDDRWWTVGQNLYTSLSTIYDESTDWKGAITSWFDEHKDYTFGSGFSKATGHYTQVVWADSDHVGCGYTHYATSGRFPYQKLYVCNYGPGGNIQGQDPYKTK